MINYYLNGGAMQYKFERLEVWKLAMNLNTISYDIADILPDKEKFNLGSQLRRASTLIALNVAEGSTGQTNAEQQRFLSFAMRSYIEVIACIRLIEARGYSIGVENLLNQFEKIGYELFNKLLAFKKALKQ